VSHSLANPAFL